MAGVCQLRGWRKIFFATFAVSFAPSAVKGFFAHNGNIQSFNRKGRKGHRKGRKENQELRGAFLLMRFQYKYPGTPISTIAVPAKDSTGRVMMVLSVQAPPIRT